MLFPDGAIYAVGGYDGINYVSSVERLDPRVRFYSLISQVILNILH